MGHRVAVDRDLCTGIGMCASLVPDHFEVDDDGVMHLLDAEVGDAVLSEVENAVACCPNQALRLERS